MKIYSLSPFFALALISGTCISCSGSIFSKDSANKSPSAETPSSAPADKNLAPETNTTDSGEAEIVDAPPPQIKSKSPNVQEASLLELFDFLAPDLMKKLRAQMNDNQLLESLTLRILIANGLSDKGGNITHEVIFEISQKGTKISSIKYPMKQIRDDLEASTRSLILNTDTQAHDTITESALGLSLRFQKSQNTFALKRGVLIQYIKHAPGKSYQLDSTPQINVIVK